MKHNIAKHFTSNPLSDFMDEETFKKLLHEKVFELRGIRNYYIRKKFKEMRQNNVCVDDAILELQQHHCPDLRWDTIRKICYGVIPYQQKVGDCF